MKRLLVARGAHGPDLDNLLSVARGQHVQIDVVDRVRLDALADHHQGVVAEARPFGYATLEQVLDAACRAGADGLVLALDSIQDPQNLGTLLRTAAAVGVDGVLIPEHRAAGVTAAVTKSSSGATERLPIARVGNLVRALDQAKLAGLWVIGLDAHAGDEYSQVDLTVPVVVVVGGEERGLRPSVRQACDRLARLPMPGGTNSLNAAVAGSVVLYEAVRQRGALPQDADT